MTINRLFFSHSNYDWTGHPSKLLDSNNLDKEISQISKNDYHTSIEDISTSNIQKVIKSAHEIHIVDLDLEFISQVDFTRSFELYSYGRLLYELSNARSKVKNFKVIDDFNLTKFNKTINYRHLTENVLWTVGCSITAGDGIEKFQRYGKLLADKLNKTEITLSKSGASIFWAADQILRSDIQKDDIIVWGLTNIERSEYAINWELNSTSAPNFPRLIPKKLQYWPLEYFNSTVHISLCIRYILQVINFCNKVGAKLYIANLYDPTWIPVVLKDYKCFIDLTADLSINQCIEFIDIGDDNVHPGPKQHEHYATMLYNLISTTG